jgi:hypothetical protein
MRVSFQGSRPPVAMAVRTAPRFGRASTGAFESGKSGKRTESSGRFTLPVFGFVSALLASVFSPASTEATPATERTAPTAVETLINRVCSDLGKPVVIVDNFAPPAASPDAYPKNVDINGDGSPDEYHGGYIRSLYEARGHRTLEVNLAGESSLPNVIRVFNDLADKITAGTLAPSAISFSQAIDLTYAGASAELGLEPVLTPENMGARRQEVLNALMKTYPQLPTKELVAAFQRVADTGVPIIGIAGNQGVGKFNLMNLLPGVITVGALGYNGNRTAYTADNSLVGFWRRGEHVVLRTEAGADINADGTVDYPADRLSAGESIVRRYVGTRPVVRQIPGNLHSLREMAPPPVFLRILRDELPEGLYRTRELGELYGMSEALINAKLARGEYLHKSGEYSFSTDHEGRLVYNPDGTGNPNQVALLSGTSYAPPLICEGAN